MKSQTYRMTMLYDFYGDLLTDRQREFFDLYYNEDLSLAEIAEHYGITRQGVRDIIVRAEAALQEIEEKTGLIERYHTIQNVVDSMRETISEVKTLNHDVIQSNALNALTQRLDNALSLLGKE